jgi:hypothetical protein
MSEFETGFLPAWRAMLLDWFLHLSGFCCASEALPPTRWDDESTLQIKLSVGAWWDLLPAPWGMHPDDKGGDNSPSFIIPDEPPSNVARNYELRYESLRQISSKQCLLCWHRLSGLVSKGWVPRTKGSHLIYSCKQVTEAKSKA